MDQSQIENSQQLSDENQESGSERQSRESGSIQSQNDESQVLLGQHSMNESKKSINYGLNPDQYLSEVNKIVERRFSKVKSDDSNQKDESQDREVQSIINEVLNKRKRLSRLSNQIGSKSDYDFIEKHAKNKASLAHIEQVNQRLREQNDQIAKNIKRLTQKLTKLGNLNGNQMHLKTKSVNSSVGTLQTSQVIEIKQRQLEKLRVRLQKAEKANSRMELEISKIQQSRRTNSKKKSQSNNARKYESTDFEIRVNCPEYESKNQSSIQKQKIKTQRPQSKFTSPNRKDYYSPIMQFQEYSLKNEPTISVYENSLQKTSQFGIQLIPSQPSIERVQLMDSWTQEAMGMPQIVREENQLDLQMMRLEEIIRKNNGTISRHESLLFRQAI